MPDQTVRELGTADAAIWHALRHEGLALFPTAFLITAEEAAARDPAADLTALAEGGRFAVFDGDEALGIAALRRMPLIRTRHRAEIGPFYIRPAAQGSGAANVLMAALVAHARARGITQLELFVEAENPRAVAFYERHGFRRCGHVPNAVILADGPHDDCFYVRTL